MEKKNVIVFSSWIIFSMIILFFAMQIQLDKLTMESHGIKIPKYVYQKGIEVYENDPGFFVCDLEKNECLLFGKIPKQYKGPVQEGYDESHFRKTGETILK